MSGRDDPFDRGGKTVIRPSPGGAPLGPDPRRPQPGAWQPMPSGPAPFDPRSNAPAYPQPGGSFGGMPAGGQDDWLRGPPAGQSLFPDRNTQAGPVSEAPKIPLEVALNARDGGQISAANPITAAAAPLLILLGRLRLMIVDMQAVPLMQHVAKEIAEFERRVLAAGVDQTDARIAQYALCATADDIVQNLPGTDKHVWLQYSMVAQFFQVRTSGVVFYEELAKILHNPAPRYNLLELMHACLSLGFEGQYRGSAGGATELQRIRRDVYQTLRHLKGRNDDDISPRWRGLELRMPSLTSRVPIWAIAVAAAAILMGVFFLLRVLLGNDVDVVADRLVALHSSGQIALERAAFIPADLPDFRDQTQLERIRAALADDIAAGGVAVDSVGDFITVRVSNVLLFDSGSATVRNDFQPLAERIAAALQNEPGSIQVIGHTDNVKPSGTGRFKSNHDLSVARAEAVKSVMEAHIADDSRFVVEGKGDLQAIADNGTAAGRAQNRRVELMIPREETLSL